MTRRLLVLTTALFALCAPSAGAATYCVPSGTGCDASFATLQNAVNFANIDPAVRDTIRLSAGDFNGNVTVSATNLVEIVGAGQGADGTVLRSGTSFPALDVRSASRVSNLRVRVESQSGFETGVMLDGVGTVGDGITVLGEPGVNNAAGVIVRTGAVLQELARFRCRSRATRTRPSAPRTERSSRTWPRPATRWWTRAMPATRW